MTEHEVAFLEATKLKYMYSKHLSFLNFIKYENIEFPDTLKADSFLHWNAEKRKWLKSQIQSIAGLHESYLATLLERLDVLSAIQDKLVLKLQETEKVYEIRFISQSLSTVVRLYDETVAKLDVDAIVDTAYESNKTETDKLFLDTEEDDYDLEEHKDQSEV